MAKNPLAVSTGMGQGEAQVFGDTYNPYWKERRAEAAARQKSAQELMDFDTSKAWDRDDPVLAAEISKVREAYNKNARRIMEGDNTALLEVKKAQQELTNTINASMASKERWLDLKKNLDGKEELYTDESKQLLDEFAKNPGNYNYADLKLDRKFDYNKFIDEQASVIKKMDMKDGKFRVNPQGLPGKFSNFDILTAYSATPEEAVREYVDNVWSQEGSLADQMRELYNNDKEKMFQDLNRFRQTKTDQRTPKESQAYSTGRGIIENLTVDTQQSPISFQDLVTGSNQKIESSKDEGTSLANMDISGLPGNKTIYMDAKKGTAVRYFKDTEVGEEVDASQVQQTGQVPSNGARLMDALVFKPGFEGLSGKSDMSGKLVSNKILDQGGLIVKKVDGKLVIKDISDQMQVQPSFLTKDARGEGERLTAIQGNESIATQINQKYGDVILENYKKSRGRGFETYDYAIADKLDKQIKYLEDFIVKAENETIKEYDSDEIEVLKDKLEELKKKRSGSETSNNQENIDSNTEYYIVDNGVEKIYTYDQLKKQADSKNMTFEEFIEKAGLTKK